MLRRPVDDVEAEIAAAEKAQREAKREAAKELRRGRRERGQQQVHAKVEQLKAKLSAPRDGGRRLLAADRESEQYDR